MTRLTQLTFRLKKAKKELLIREKNHNAPSRWYNTVTQLILKLEAKIELERTKQRT